jgi:hypothetical protein
MKCPCGAVLALPEKPLPAVLCPKCRRRLAVPAASAAVTARPQRPAPPPAGQRPVARQVRQTPSGGRRVVALALAGAGAAALVLAALGVGAYYLWRDDPSAPPAPADVRPEAAWQAPGRQQPEAPGAEAAVGEPRAEGLAPAPQPPAAKGPAAEPVALQRTRPKTLRLPAAATDAVAGGGGRFLVVHLPTLRKLAVVDLLKQQISHYVPADGDPVLFAAGLDRLVLVFPQRKTVERWSLLRAEKEQSAPLALDNLSRVAVGSASRGPVLLLGAGSFDLQLAFLDLQSLKPWDVRFTRKDRANAGPDLRLRATPDGTLFSLWGTQYSPQGALSLALHGNDAKLINRIDSLGHVIPGPTGKFLYTAHGRFTPELNPYGKAGSQVKWFTLPAQQGNLFLELKEADRQRLAAVYLEGDDRPLVTLDRVPLPVIDVWGRAGFNTDRRVWFLPHYDLIATFARDDQIDLTPLDLDGALARAGADYLYLTSQQPAAVERGEALSYQIAARSRAGKLTFQLDAGPPGMKVSAAGRVEWRVAKDFPERQAEAVVKIRDGAGQELLHAFKVGIPGEPPVAVAQDPPAGGKPQAGEGPAGAGGWKEYVHAEGGFAARFPAAPKLATGKGKDGLTGSAGLDLPQGVHLEVSFTDLDKEVAAAGPAFFLEAMAKQMNPGSRKEVKLGGLAGLELTLGMGKETVRTRIFLVKARLYQVTAAFAGGPADPALAGQFLDSFRLTEVAAGAASAPVPVGEKFPYAWKTYTHPEGRYRLDFPADPGYQATPTPNGYHGGGGAAAPNRVRFDVNFIDFKVPFGAVAAMAAEFGVPQEKRTVTMAGGAATEALCAGRDRKSLVLVRLFNLKNRFFRLWVTFPGGEVDRATADHFFGSFAPVKGPALDLPKADVVVRLGEPTLRTVEDTGGLPSVAFAPDGKTLAVGTSRGAVVLYDFPALTGAARLKAARKPGFGKEVTQLAFSPDGGSLAAACGAENTVKVIDTARRQDRALLIVGERANAVVFAGDGQTVAVAVDREPAVKLWDVPSGQPVGGFKQHRYEPRCLAVSADGKTLASGDSDRQVALWDLGKKTLKRFFQVEDFGTFLCVGFSKNGQLLAAGDSGKKVRVYNLLEGSLLYTLQGHGNDVTCLAFSPDGRLLVSGSRDKTVRFWSLASGRQVRVELLDDHVQALAFSPDGRHLAATSGDAVLRVWELAGKVGP